MKFMESKKVYSVIRKTGESVFDATIKCFGNASYRVYLDGEAVVQLFSSEEEATAYAKDCADMQAMFHNGTVAAVEC